MSLAFCGRCRAALGEFRMGVEDTRAVLVQGLAARGGYV